MSLKRSLHSIGTIVALATSYGCSTANQTVPYLNPNVRAAPAAASAKPGAKTVLLVSDSGTNEVLLLAYPGGTVLKTLAGFSEPQGTCSDGAGHFWIANTGDSNVLEYSTGGTLLNTLVDPNNYPVSCAYDPKTGDLAVMNIITTADGPGNVVIYSKAKGTPKIYSGAPLQRIYFGAYDGSTGTLVVDGENSSYDFAMASLKGGRFKEVTLKGATIEFPGGLGWSTKVHSMNVCDQEGAVIYRFLLSGKVTGTIALNGSLVSYAIFGGTLLAPTSQGIDVYAYPAGGAPKRVISEGGFSEPIGIAVSSAVTE